jgi:septal ring factor EnvC (AmiA/AmiB activator)
MNGNSQETGTGMMGIGMSMLIQGMQSDPAEDARRSQEAAQAAEQQRRADEQRRADDLRQQEIAKQRILGMLKGTEQSSDLSLKTGGEDSPLTVTETRGAFGSTVLTPAGINSPPTDQGLQLKLGDDADSSIQVQRSMQAQQGFDTSGKIMGSNLPPPPPTPTSDSTPQAKKTQLLNALNSKLKENEAKEQSLKDQLAQLQQSPTPDPVAIGQVQSKLNEVTTTNTQLTQNIEKVTAGETNIGFDEEKGPGDNTAPAVSPSR